MRDAAQHRIFDCGAFKNTRASRKKKPQVSSFTGTKLMKRHASHASQAGLRVWLCGVKTFTKTMITATEKKNSNLGQRISAAVCNVFLANFFC